MICMLFCSSQYQPCHLLHWAKNSTVYFINCRVKTNLLAKFREQCMNKRIIWRQRTKSQDKNKDNLIQYLCTRLQSFFLKYLPNLGRFNFIIDGKRLFFIEKLRDVNKYLSPIRSLTDHWLFQVYVRLKPEFW